MKKIVTIGATAMMGFTALGGFQGMVHANTFAHDLLGTAVHADTTKKAVVNDAIRLKLADGYYLYTGNGALKVNNDAAKNDFTVTVNGKAAAAGTALNAGDKFVITFKKDATDDPSNTRASMGTFKTGTTMEFVVNTDGSVSRTDGKVLAKANALRFSFGNGTEYLVIDGNAKLKQWNTTSKDYVTVSINGKAVNMDNNRNYGDALYTGDVVTITFKKDATDIPTDAKIRTSLGTFKAGAKQEFKVQADGLFETTQDDQTKTTTLTFKHTPGEPVWYAVAPASNKFSDDSKDEDVDATIKIAGDAKGKTAYTGTGKVDVSVKSANGFNLQEGKVAVPYALTDKGGKVVNTANDKAAEKLATLDATTSSVKYNFHLTGANKQKVTTNANLTDTLTYTFHQE